MHSQTSRIGSELAVRHALLDTRELDGRRMVFVVSLWISQVAIRGTELGRGSKRMLTAERTADFRAAA